MPRSSKSYRPGRIGHRQVNYLYEATSGVRAWLTEADITVDGEIITVYIKLFGPRSHGMIGETIRWMLAGALEIPQPQRAWLVQVPTTMLSALWPERNWEAEWGKFAPAWACEQIHGEAPAVRRLWYRDSTLERELFRWVALAKVVALDEWLANNDNNLGNLLYVASKADLPKWYIIDGEACLDPDTHGQWTEQSLSGLLPGPKRRAVHNKLGVHAFGAFPSDDDRHRLLKIATTFKNILLQVRQDMMLELNDMLGDLNIALQILDLLEKRANLGWMAPTTP